MPYPSEPRLRVLHVLRLKWVADEERISAASGLPLDTVDVELGVLAAEGLVRRRDGRVTGWSLTDEGKDAHAKAVHTELEESGARDAVADAYSRFLDHNTELLSLCTAWQMRDGPGGEPVLNDHRDAAYDAAVLARLEAVHAAIGPVTADLAGALDRFAAYGPRLDRAHERVVAGETDWLTKPLIDSYHTVWFELHEDLLVTLGLERREGET